MRIRSSLLLTLSLALCACQVQIATQPTGKRPASDRAQQAKASPKPSSPASADPSTAPASPSPSTSALPSIQPSPSLAPPEPTTLLKGLVKIDPSYVISVGGGNIIATGGGNVIATGGGNFVSTNSGTVIATGGGNVIATGGGNVISVGGGNVISVGGGNYRLLADAITVPTGTLLPVKGMAVVPVSLVTRQIVGTPVLTGETGEYAIALPQSVKENILMVALWPGATANDPIMQDTRLQYELMVSSTDTASQALNEDSALVSRYIRETFESKFAFFLKPKSSTGGGSPELFLPPVLKTLVDGIHGEFFAELEKAGIAEDEAKVSEAGALVARRVLSHPQFDLREVKLNTTLPGSEGLDEEPVVPLLIKLMSAVRGSTSTLLAADKAVFETKAYMTGATTKGPDGQTVKILKASDMCDFLVSEYLGADYIVFGKIDPLWADLKLSDLEKKQLWASGQAIGLGMFQAIMTKPDIKQAALAAVREYASKGASPAPSPSAAP